MSDAVLTAIYARMGELEAEMARLSQALSLLNGTPAKAVARAPAKSASRRRAGTGRKPRGRHAESVLAYLREHGPSPGPAIREACGIGNLGDVMRSLGDQVTRTGKRPVIWRLVESAAPDPRPGKPSGLSDRVLAALGSRPLTVAQVAASADAAPENVAAVLRSLIAADDAYEIDGRFARRP